MSGKLDGLSSRSLAILRRIILVDARHGARLYGKTGWLFDIEPEIGWWIGWIEREGSVEAFALNIDLTSPDDAKKRVDLGRAILKPLGLW